MTFGRFAGVFIAFNFCTGIIQASESEPAPDLMDTVSPWANGVGNGFRQGARAFGVNLGAGFGTETFGSHHRHDLALANVEISWVLSPVLGSGHWYEGNWELGAELFGGSQFEPKVEYVFGLTPLLRYDFATQTRWMPFWEAGAGPTATSIRQDLSTTFEFNIQTGTGVRYFFNESFAGTLEFRWLHLSNGRLQEPNEGTNTSMFILGVAWYF
jgi:lipid A 3-O-deacylase